ncbi:hypothetical protein XELAEV_18019358mg [Xenopus laevis]|uniref:Uncharacterized protein n=1 Tax=Xenopus laevis TaxID=8355 RepID=A0A974DH05_XENLA|nr:hypothetical protein XELAEV_18019358mg [Xenopus laevis]
MSVSSSYPCGGPHTVHVPFHLKVVLVVKHKLVILMYNPQSFHYKFHMFFYLSSFYIKLKCFNPYIRGYQEIRAMSRDTRIVPLLSAYHLISSVHLGCPRHKMAA